MIGVTVVMTLLGAVLLLALLLLAEGKVKIVVVVAALAGLLISASGIAEGTRDFIGELIIEANE